MTATNHALTGAIIGLSISNPWLALPLAFASHFVLDALPHHGSTGAVDKVISSPKFARNLAIDASLCIILVAILFLSQPVNWLLAAACAFLATSPDLEWTANFFRARAGKKMKKIKDPIGRLHAKVQWFQKPIGAIVEIVWFVDGVFIVYILLKR